MKKFACLLASVFAASALTGCGSDSGDVALGMAKAVAAGDAEKLASYCSPEYKDRCNVKYAKWFIEDYQKNFAALKKYYPKAQEPGFEIGQKRHMGPPVFSTSYLNKANRHKA